MSTWLLMKGDQTGVENKCAGFEARVRAKAMSQGAKLVEADVFSAADANELLRSSSPSEVFFIGHGEGGSLTAKGGTSIWPTDIDYNPSYLKITFRSVACELGRRAKDWDLTFGDVYGSTHQMSSKGPFEKRRIHADQELYRDLVNKASIITTQAYSAKMRAFNDSAIVTRSRVTDLESKIDVLRAVIHKQQTQQAASSDPDGGYSVGTAAQVLSDLDQAFAFLQEARKLVE